MNKLQLYLMTLSLICVVTENIVAGSCCSTTVEVITPIQQQQQQQAPQVVVMTEQERGVLKRIRDISRWYETLTEKEELDLLKTRSTIANHLIELSRYLGYYGHHEEIAAAIKLAHANINTVKGLYPDLNLTKSSKVQKQRPSALIDKLELPE